MIGVVFAAAVMFAQASPAAAAANTSGKDVTPAVVNAPTNTSASAGDMDKIVCHSEPVLGTMFPKKTCATKREQQERARLDQETSRSLTAMRTYRDPTSNK